MLELKRLFKTVNIEHLWLFFTDRCNLDCDYCFFKYRSNKLTLPLKRIKVLLDTLPAEKYYNFVISGGEPLLEWPVAEETIVYARKRFPRCPIYLQTNGILMNSRMADCLKANSVIVEHGIDGSFAANLKHRKGTSRPYFDKILKSIELILKMGIAVNPTMAVHPDQTKDIYENFKFLVSLGLYSMDVHPALLQPWEEVHLHVFRGQYLKIIAEDIKNNGTLVCKDYNMPKGFRFDLVVMPDGNILPNWVYLTLPPYQKEKYYFLRIEEDRLIAENERLNFFLKAYQDFYKTPGVTYRDFSNFNVELFLKDRTDRDTKRHFENYKRICAITRELEQTPTRGGMRWRNQ